MVTLRSLIFAKINAREIFQKGKFAKIYAREISRIGEFAKVNAREIFEKKIKIRENYF